MKKYLHEVIMDIVKDNEGISVSDLTSLVNESGIYLKRDLSEVTKNQVYARISKYKNILYTANGKVYIR